MATRAVPDGSELRPAPAWLGRLARLVAEHPVGLAAASLVLLQWVLSGYAASTIDTVASHDTASYYVVGRNFALGRGLTDTVLWQFLAAPATVARPAGDYWEVGWPLVLGLLMRLFGHSQHAAIQLCAALSGLLPLLVFAVAYRLERRLASAWLAGLLVCLQVRLVATNVSPDVTLSYELACLGAFAAFFQALDRRLRGAWLVAVGAVVGLPLHLRGEGAIPALAIALGLWLWGPGARRERAWRLMALAGGVALVSVPFWLRNLVVFGEIVPASRALRLWMTTDEDLFRWLSDPSAAQLFAQGVGAMAESRWSALRSHLAVLSDQAPWPLLVAAAAGGVVRLRARPFGAGVLLLFVLLSLLLPCLAVPVIANAGRFVLNTLPVLCVLGSWGLFAGVDALRRWRKWPALPLFAVPLGALACALLFREPAGFQTYLGLLDLYRHTPACLAPVERLAPLGLAPSNVVLTTDPWRVAAVLDVAAVTFPHDGPVALDGLVAQYRPRYLLATSRQLAELVAVHFGPLEPVARFPDGLWFALPAPPE